MNISTNNEWGRLRKVILGSALNFNFSQSDPKYKNIKKLPKGPVPEHVILETEEALTIFESQLKQLNVEVLRPNPIDYVSLDAFGCYCPRDTVLVLDSIPILTPTIWEKRRVEWQSIIHYLPNAITIDDPNVILDAANVIRCNDDLLYLVSYSGNEAGADWIERNFPRYNVHRLRNVYADMHLDTTIVPLREGLVLLNAERLKDEQLPDFLKSWDKIWIQPEDIISSNTSAATSNWIAMNLFSYDEHTVFCDPKQKNIIAKLNEHGIEEIGIDLPHSKYLMGGHHCCTLDLVRD